MFGTKLLRVLHGCACLFFDDEVHSPTTALMHWAYRHCALCVFVLKFLLPSVPELSSPAATSKLSLELAHFQVPPFPRGAGENGPCSLPRESGKTGPLRPKQCMASLEGFLE